MYKYFMKEKSNFMDALSKRPWTLINYMGPYDKAIEYKKYWAPFYLHGLNYIPAWINNCIHYNVWDEITYPFLNFNGATVEV